MFFNVSILSKTQITFNLVVYIDIQLWYHSFFLTVNKCEGKNEILSYKRRLTKVNKYIYFLDLDRERERERERDFPTQEGTDSPLYSLEQCLKSSAPLS